MWDVYHLSTDPGYLPSTRPWGSEAIDDRPKEVRVIAAGGQEHPLKNPFFWEDFWQCGLVDAQNPPIMWKSTNQECLLVDFLEESST